MSTDVASGAPDEPLYHRTYEGTQSGFTLTLSRALLLHIALTGKGTLSGVEQLLAYLEESEKLLAPDDRILALVDLSQMNGAPLRAQLRLGKWLFQRRERARRIAIFGGKPIEIAVARTVMKIAQMKQVGFFSHDHEARDFLGISASA